MKQHYIPRCYLRRFSNNEKSIFAYDKVNSKSYTASLMSVCCEDDMYTLSDEYVKRSIEENGNNINNLSIEKEHFSRFVEPYYAQLLSKIDEIKDDWITGKEQYKLNYYEKKELALHIATQYFRHPKIGDAEVDNYLRMEQAGADMLKHILAIQNDNEEFDKLKIEMSYDKPALHAMLTYMDYDELMKCADIMAGNYYVFWASRHKDFYTSDFPVIVEPHVTSALHQYSGLIQYGGEIMLSLSPNLALSIYDSRYFKDKEVMDGCFVIADEKEIRRHNMMKYFYAAQHVFSYKNDFKLIEFIYNVNDKKHVFMKPHLKIEISSGLGKY